MKKNTKFGALRGLAIAGAICAYSVGVSQAALVAFSGGGGVEVTATLVNEVTWTLDAGEAAAMNESFSLIGMGIGTNESGTSLVGVTIFAGGVSTTGTGSFTIRSEEFYATHSFGGENNGGIIGFFLERSTSFSAGDTITFDAGSSISSSEVVSQTYTNGDYGIYFNSGMSGRTIAVAPGVNSVPEPSSVLLLGISAMGLVGLRRR